MKTVYDVVQVLLWQQLYAPIQHGYTIIIIVWEKGYLNEPHYKLTCLASSFLSLSISGLTRTATLKLVPTSLVCEEDDEVEGGEKDEVDRRFFEDACMNSILGLWNVGWGWQCYSEYKVYSLCDDGYESHYLVNEYYCSKIVYSNLSIT